jgi:hypothetical protein
MMGELLDKTNPRQGYIQELVLSAAHQQKKLDGMIPMVYFLPIVKNIALVILRVT